MGSDIEEERPPGYDIQRWFGPIYRDWECGFFMHPEKEFFNA